MVVVAPYVIQHVPAERSRDRETRMKKGSEQEPSIPISEGIKCNSGTGSVQTRADDF